MNEEDKKKLMLLIHSFSEMKGLGWTERDWEKKPHAMITYKEVILENGEKVNHLHITMKNSFKVKDILKRYGFKFDGKTRTWYYEGIMSKGQFKNFVRDIMPYMDAIFIDNRILNKILKTLDIEPNAVMNARIPKVQEQGLEAPTIDEVMKKDLELPDAKGDGIEEQPLNRRAYIPQKGDYLLAYNIVPESIEKIEKDIENSLKQLKELTKTHLAYVHMRDKYIRIIVDKAYDKREQLQKLGYYFNGTAKTWEKVVHDRKALNDELKKLSEIGVKNIIPIGASLENAEKNLRMGGGIER